MIKPYNIKIKAILSEYSNYSSANHISDPALPSDKHTTVTMISHATSPVPDESRKSLKQSNNSHVSHTMTPKTFAFLRRLL
jgi:hypothetical protein